MSTTLITPSAEAFLPAFNGQLNLKDACTWSLTQMKAFMLGLINSPSTHGVDENVIGEMRRLRTDIFDLCENGSKYLSEASHPQSISRIVDPNHSKDTSYFLLDSMPYRGIPYWCCYDLLGRFLSVFSPAPEGATQDNFYL
ncbi:hypothetical protein PENCOP_c001G03141 [Penicillium coprophilum]|uniref:Uncharacterized protein n=1 Tax=Penicillium coprophilum TaxID=36646 RepID=A0A1V6V6Q0_9EURO|nr:hypothetical protein PENCOP_c001G03141 [Penicillium coprophilum]